MFLDLKDIGSETLSFDGDVQVPEEEWYRGESIRFPFAHADVQVARTEGRLALRGKVAVRVTLNCGRCLAGVDWEWASPLALTLLPTGTDEVGAANGRGETEVEGEDEWRLDGTVLDVGRLCREFALLHLPLKPVCREDCRGLCPQCGANRNEKDCGCAAETPDPRMAALLEFKKKLDSD